MAATGRAQRTRRKIAGVRLRALRERYGLSLDEAARALALGDAELRAREQGLAEVSAEELWALTLYLGVAPAEVFRVPVAPGAAPAERAITVRRKALGSALTMRREARGLSPEAAEASTGLPEGRLLSIERGDESLSLSDLEALAEVYGCSAEEMLDEGQPGGPSSEDTRRFMRRPESNRYVLAAMALSRLDAEALSALQDVVDLLREEE